MNARTHEPSTAGIVLVGSYPWNHPAFDALAPRALLPVAHRPLISFVTSWLHSGGVAAAWVCGNRDTAAVGVDVDRHAPPGMVLRYRQDQMPRGTAGSARDAASASAAADLFVVVDGASIPLIPLAEILDAHRSSGALATIVVHTEPGAGGMALDVATGIYVFDRAAFAGIPETGFCDIKENLIPQLYRARARVVPFHAPAPSVRVLDPASYLAANDWVIGARVCQLRSDPGWVALGAGVAHRESSIDGSAIITGPVLIGKGVRIEAGAVIVGPASIGHDAIVEAGAVVARSAVWRRCRVGAHAIADRAILGDGACLGSRARAYRQVMASPAGAAPVGGARPSPVPQGGLASPPAWRRLARALADAGFSESATSR